MAWWVVIPGALVGLGEALRRPRRWLVALASAIGASAFAFALHWFCWMILGAGWPEVRTLAEDPMSFVAISLVVVALGGLDLRRPSTSA
jgi:hypothetical protein